MFPVEVLRRLRGKFHSLYFRGYACHVSGHMMSSDFTTLLLTYTRFINGLLLSSIDWFGL